MWREATVIPLPKSGKLLDQPERYRPISLTCCLRKLMEEIVNDRLFLECKNVLRFYQAGYRKKYNSVDHIVNFEIYIYDNFLHRWEYFSIWLRLMILPGNSES